MNSACVHSAIIRGIEAVPVTVEARLVDGLPGLCFTGVRETTAFAMRERVRAAILSAGFKMPNSLIQVSVSPAEPTVRETGLDLAVAVAILTASKQIDSAKIDDLLLFGELNIAGGVERCRGSLAAESLATKLGLIFTGNLAVGTADQRAYIRIANLGDMRGALVVDSGEVIEPCAPVTDFSELDLDAATLRAVVVAAAGGHDILLLSPADWGRELIASRIPGILPAADTTEIKAWEELYNIDNLDYWAERQGQRPFRYPHHSATSAGLVGGGNPVRPGEATLADGGVLYLDQIEEYSKNVLVNLRAVRDEGSAHIVRADGRYNMPANFLLVAGANTCACGRYGNNMPGECTCSPERVSDYQHKIGGPLRDAFDISVCLNRPIRLRECGRGVSSEELRAQVVSARNFAARRDAAGADSMDREARALLGEVSECARISEKRLAGIVAVARTIADLDCSEVIAAEHMHEALGLQLVRLL